MCDCCEESSDIDFDDLLNIGYLTDDYARRLCGDAHAELDRLRAELAQARAWSEKWKSFAKTLYHNCRLVAGFMSAYSVKNIIEENAHLRADIARLSGAIEGRDYATESFRERLCKVLGLDYEHQSGTDDVMIAIEKLCTEIERTTYNACNAALSPLPGEKAV